MSKSIKQRGQFHATTNYICRKTALPRCNRIGKYCYGFAGQIMSGFSQTRFLTFDPEAGPPITLRNKLRSNHASWLRPLILIGTSCLNPELPPQGISPHPLQTWNRALDSPPLFIIEVWPSGIVIGTSTSLTVADQWGELLSTCTILRLTNGEWDNRADWK